MNVTTEKKSTDTFEKKASPADIASASADAKQSSTSTTPEKPTIENLREAINALDAERSALVKYTIENIKPGKPFDSSVVRDINKLETRKNRLIVARLAALLRTNGPDVQAIVHQIIEL